MVCGQFEMVRQLTGRMRGRGWEPADRRIRAGRLLCLVFSLVILLSLAAPAEAADPFRYRDSEGNKVLFTEYEARIRAGWTLLRNAALYLGAAALACLALRALLGSEKEMEQLKKAGLWIVLAVFALSVLPGAVKLGTDTGQKYGWTPPGPAVSQEASGAGGGEAESREDAADPAGSGPDTGTHPEGWG